MAKQPKSENKKAAGAGAGEAAAGGAADGSTGLETFLATAGSLTPTERLAIVNQAILLLEGFYVHLPLKRAMHAVDPLQRLRLLRHRLDQLGGETRFHAEMTSIFTSVRDLHTNYMLPSPYAEVVAILPFRVEACFEAGKRRYIAVTAATETMPDPAFKDGVVLTHWNGVPIDRAVAAAADRHAGSNPAARHSRGLAGLTQRPLIVVPPPDEEWASVSYIGLDGIAREARFEWRTLGLPSVITGADPDAVSDQATALGFDLETIAVQRARQDLFAPHVAEAQLAIAAAGGDSTQFVQGTASTMPDVFTAKPVTTASGTFGYIRIRTFSVNSDEAFVQEFVRLAELMPKQGLIIDVRDNGGGLIYAGERLLQTLTPKTIEPERLQFINTALTKTLSSLHGAGSQIDLSAWAPSIARAVETGASFSCSFPITPPERCNDIGQRYHGPVVLITSARCYSTTDIFSAGFQDHAIGKVLGVDNNTGAGGANVWTHALLLQLLGVGGNPPPLAPLPRNSGMRVAIRRTLRVGRQAGTELEDLGVVPDFEHKTTRRDVLEGNLDLIDKAAALLAAMPRFTLDATAAKVAGKLRVNVTTANVQRLDFELDGRPQRSDDVTDGSRVIDLPTALAHGKLALRGYRNGELVAARRLTF
ncbi:MAG TPA: S41 family peptidase [Allosphingosinicella sp.]|nr:S41 family peptidase [Allosphingosinicella sp.]